MKSTVDTVTVGRNNGTQKKFLRNLARNFPQEVIAKLDAKSEDMKVFLRKKFHDHDDILGAPLALRDEIA